MKIRSLLAIVALCAAAAFAACALDHADDAPPDDEANPTSPGRATKPPSNAQCKKFDPTWDAASKHCRQGAKGIHPGQFIPSSCCGQGKVCEGAALDKIGKCHGEDGTFIPQACCDAACGKAELDKFGFCRATAKGVAGQFRPAACCADQCLALVVPTASCTAELCVPEGTPNDGGCFCDDTCVNFGDCCANKPTACPAGRGRGGNPIAGACAKELCGTETEAAGGCFCDELCVQFGDCCPNKTEVCGGRSVAPGPRHPAPRAGSCISETCGQPANQGANACFCDDACAEFGDCCENKVDVCGAGDARRPGARGDLTGSCTQRTCGAQAADGNCFCDDQCLLSGDCCANATSVCELSRVPRGRPGARLAGSCAGTPCDGPGNPARGEETASCFCDDQCTQFGDCCADKPAACQGNGNVPPRPLVAPGFCKRSDCKNGESETPASGGAGECFCDESCAGFGDCCANKVNVCGGTGIQAEVIDCKPDACAGASVDAEGACRLPSGNFAKTSCCATVEQCNEATIQQDGSCKAGDKTVPALCCKKQCGKPQLTITAAGISQCKNGANGRFVKNGCCADQCLQRQEKRRGSGRAKDRRTCERVVP